MVRAFVAMAFSDLIYSHNHISPVLPNITYRYHLDISPASYVLQGSNANITCVATGSPPPAITWTLNGQPTPYQSSSFSVLPSSITCGTVFPGVAASYLLITSISSSGNYTCNATNINGSSWQSVYIEVQGNNVCSCCVDVKDKKTLFRFACKLLVSAFLIPIMHRCV